MEIVFSLKRIKVFLDLVVSIFRMDYVMQAVTILSCGHLLTYCNGEEKKDPNRVEKDTVSSPKDVDPKPSKGFDPESLRLKFDPTPVRRLSEIPGLSAAPTMIRPDLMTEFCIHVYKLPLKADFNTELAYFCDPNKKPTSLFTDIDRYLKIQADKIQAVDLVYQVDGARSKSVVIGISEVPIPPKFVREAHIADFMVARAEFGNFTHDGKVVSDQSAALRGTLQFGKYVLAYDTTNTTKDGKSFSNSRSTEANAYQAKVGDPDIGICTEHLLGNSDSYKYYKTVTIIIGTASGGSAIISLANLDVANNGYPNDARASAIDSGTAQATHVHDGVLAEKADRIIR